MTRAPTRGMGIPVVLALLAASCAASRLPAAAGATAPVASPPGAGRVLPLEVDESRHIYFVRVQVNGRPARMIVDLGSTGPIVSRAFADSLAADQGAPVGFAGPTPGVAGTVGPLRFSVDDETLLEARVATIDHPQLQSLGAVGVFTPQTLATPARAVVLDLAARQLRLVPASSDAARLPASAGRSLGAGDVKRCPTTPTRLPFRAVLFDAVVDGVPAVLAAALGSERSAVFSESSAGLKLLPDAGESELLPGPLVRAQGRHARTVTLAAGEYAAPVTFDIIDGGAVSICPYDGVLGVELLARCTLVLRHDGADARCR